jgi:hypothetical protein
VSSGSSNGEKAQNRHNLGTTRLPLAYGGSATGGFLLLRRAASAWPALLQQASAIGFPTSKTASAAAGTGHGRSPGGLNGGPPERSRCCAPSLSQPDAVDGLTDGKTCAPISATKCYSRSATRVVNLRPVSHVSCGAGWKRIASNSRSDPFLFFGAPCTPPPPLLIGARFTSQGGGLSEGKRNQFTPFALEWHGCPCPE